MLMPKTIYLFNASSNPIKNNSIKILSLICLMATGVATSGCSTFSKTTPLVKSAPNALLPDATPYSLSKSAAALKQTTAKNQPIIALVLGSGGARGYAHIGVIRMLEAYGISPQLIVGTSAGSIVGALYASGKNADQMEKIAQELKGSDVRDIAFSKQGFFEGKKVEDFVNRQVNYQPIEKLNIPLFIVATELQHGTRTVFNQGNTGQAVAASVSIPSMFIPTRIGKLQYVDGGLVSPVPVEVAKELGADVVIAVNILAQPENTPTSNIWGLFNQNINVMQNRLAAYEMKAADVVIQPVLKEKQHIFSLDARNQTMIAGEESALAQMDNIKYAIGMAHQRIQQQQSIQSQSKPQHNEPANLHTTENEQTTQNENQQ